MTVILFFTLFLVGCSIFVNGWTDAPNAIATVVSTRVMSPKAAIMMGAFFNFLGVFLMGTAVASTTANIISITSGSEGLITLASAQLAIVLWAVGAWRFGIPTSESHALVAGLMGAGMSLNGLAALNVTSITKVFGGLFIFRRALSGFARRRIVVVVVVVRSLALLRLLRSKAAWEFRAVQVPEMLRCQGATSNAHTI